MKIDRILSSNAIRFSLAKLLLLTTAVAVCLACWIIEPICILFFGLPALLLLVVGSPNNVLGSNRPNYRRVFVASMLYLGNVVGTICLIGYPASVASLLFLFSPIAWFAALIAITPRFRKLSLCLPLVLVPLACLARYSGTVYVDTARSRLGTPIFPGFIYASLTDNYLMLVKYLGNAEPQWTCWFYSISRGGNDPVVVHLAVFQPWLNSALGMLPTEKARHDVLTALTDKKNLARMHQTLLLHCLVVKGFPQGYDADKWWKKHEQFFKSFAQPNEAARAVWGWADKVGNFKNIMHPQNEKDNELEATLRATQSAERGRSSQFDPLAEQILTISPTLGQSNLGVDSIEWWKE